MLVVDHRTGTLMRTGEVLAMLAARRDYGTLLDAARVNLDDLPAPDYDRTTNTLGYDGDLSLQGRYVAYSLNQESFRFMLDPMLQNGSERISAMGYGNAINALSDTEGGMAKYFSQRFAQVTNPPLDSIREADGMSMRVDPRRQARRHRHRTVGTPTRQLVVRVPDPRAPRHGPPARPGRRAARALRHALRAGARRRAGQRRRGARRRDRARATPSSASPSAPAASRCCPTARCRPRTRALPVILAVAAVNQRLIETGLRLRVSVVAECGQLPSSHHVATALGFGAAAVYSLSARLRAEEKYPAAAAPAGELTATDLALKQFRKAAEKALAKTMGRVGLCTAESYIGGEFFEPNYLDTRDDLFARVFPHMDAPVGGVGFARIAQAATDWHERARTRAGRRPGPAARPVQGAVGRRRALVRRRERARLRRHDRGAADLRARRRLRGAPPPDARPARRRLRHHRRGVPQHRLRPAQRVRDRRLPHHARLPDVPADHARRALPPPLRAPRRPGAARGRHRASTRRRTSPASSAGSR